MARVNEQSLYYLMTMGISLPNNNDVYPIQSLFYIYAHCCYSESVILVFVLAPNFDLQIIIHQACRLVQCFKPLELVPF